MTDAIQPVEAPPVLVTEAQVEIVRRTVFPGSSPDELAMFLHDCQRQRVHPLDRLIHPTFRKAKDGSRRYTPITSIDLMRSRAESTGEYAGNDEAVFRGTPREADFSAAVTVWKIVRGVRCAFTATARWSEYRPDEAFMWNKMPHTMLGKCAEALALRKAFPRDLSGIYSREEMAQAGIANAPPPVEGEPVPTIKVNAEQNPKYRGTLLDLKKFAKEAGGLSQLKREAVRLGYAGRDIDDLDFDELDVLHAAIWPRDPAGAATVADDSPEGKKVNANVERIGL